MKESLILRISDEDMILLIHKYYIMPSIRDWVLRNKWYWMEIIHVENSWLILEKENYIFFNFILCNFLVRMLGYFLKKFQIFLTPKTKNSPKTPLDNQFPVQQIFALWNWNSFKVWNYLIFEVVKLCRIKKYLRISKMQVQ